MKLNVSVFIVLGCLALLTSARPPRFGTRLIRRLARRIELVAEELVTCRAALPQTTTQAPTTEADSIEFTVDDTTDNSLEKRDFGDMLRQIRMMREDLSNLRDELEECLDKLADSGSYEDDR